MKQHAASQTLDQGDKLMQEIDDLEQQLETCSRTESKRIRE